jgi:2-oxoglutarate ferredoxin oxidoreductase subunit delta
MTPSLRKDMANSESTPDTQPSGRVKTPAAIEIKVSWCKGCGLCVDYCSLGVLEMSEGLPKVVKLEKCTRCMQCEVICPDFAIRVTEAAPPAAVDAQRKERS